MEVFLRSPGSEALGGLLHCEPRESLRACLRSCRGRQYGSTVRAGDVLWTGLAHNFVTCGDASQISQQILESMENHENPRFFSLQEIHVV